MKRLNDYKDAELSVLTDEQINNLIDLECAFAGAPLLPERPTAPNELTTSPDVEVYVVGDAIFVNQEDAQAAVDFANNKPRVTTDWDYRYGSKFRFLGEADAPTLKISPMSVYSVEAYNSMTNALEKYRAEKALFDEKSDEYKTVVSARASTAQEVWDRIEAARRAVYKLGEDRAKYQRYLALAEGDQEVALKFLCDALGITLETALEIAEGIAEPEGGPDA